MRQAASFRRGQQNFRTLLSSDAHTHTRHTHTTLCASWVARRPLLPLRPARRRLGESGRGGGGEGSGRPSVALVNWTPPAGATVAPCSSLAAVCTTCSHQSCAEAATGLGGVWKAVGHANAATPNRRFLFVPSLSLQPRRPRGVARVVAAPRQAGEWCGSGRQEETGGNKGRKALPNAPHADA